MIYYRKTLSSSGPKLTAVQPNELKYNQANCQLTADALNKEQAHYQNSIYSKIKINYWCEKGDYKK